MKTTLGRACPTCDGQGCEAVAASALWPTSARTLTRCAERAGAVGSFLPCLTKWGLWALRTDRNTDKERPWHERSGSRFALRDENGIRSVLMHRICDADGLSLKGDEAPWRDIATFPNSNDARMVLRLIAASRLEMGG